MINSMGRLADAQLARYMAPDAQKHIHDTPEKCIEFLNEDAKLAYLRRLSYVNDRAEKTAKRLGYVGVGIITFAEDRMATLNRRATRAMMGKKVVM
ncbi:hypothetical protein [Thalassobius sp. Cn5-15]|uniref:hypothetical protein n=1 Tax=Thalassobius sp. Cn5-15 TaxID=2917763 RepID=UPI001EF386B4|nr:hypothetical protein [Thalassobius sp. Cn5-15]MCG7492416.1 hypothetical protein [Thalassobius sp. Cn5-15]